MSVCLWKVVQLCSPGTGNLIADRCGLWLLPSVAVAVGFGALVYYKGFTINTKKYLIKLTCIPLLDLRKLFKEKKIKLVS